MKTPQEYLDKGYNITPCGTKDPNTGEFNCKRPKLSEWQKHKATAKDFNGKDNIGLILEEVTDIDIDNVIVKGFINLEYLKACSAVYGRKSNPRSHFVFKGKSTHKKFAMPDEFEKWCKNFPHGQTLLEVRSGEGKQSIAPGSTVKGEKVEWVVYEGINLYGGDLYEDACTLALITALTILYPKTGNRDDYCFAIACILARGTDWTDSYIDDFVYDIACKANDEEAPKRRGKGTHARKQIETKGHTMGFTTLQDKLNLDDAKGLYKIFSWIGIELPDQNLDLIRDKYYYFEDTGEMYDPKKDLSYNDKHFNNKWLYEFPGTRGKKKDDKAFAKLLKDPEFQERKLAGRAMLPGMSCPVAEIKPGDHPLLQGGRYYNLYQGRPLEPEKGDVSEVIKHFKKIFGEKNWEHLEQYLAFCIRNPGVKTRWIPLIVSVEGVGKGLLMRMISKLIGTKYVNENVSFADITEKHSVIAVGALFICLNEVVLDKQYSTKRTISSKIKPFITDDFLNINDKGIRPYKYLNNCNALVFSNDKDCLHVDTSSRRYLVIHCKTTAKEVEKMTDRGEFEPLWKMLDEHPNYLLDHFLNIVKIKDEKIYQRRAPKTPELLEMIEDSKHDTIGELDEALAEKAPPFDEEYFRGFLSKKMLVNFIRKEWHTPHPPIKLINEWLKDKGIPWKDGKKTRQIVMKNGARPRVFLLENKRGILKDLSEGDLGDMISGARGETDHYAEQIKLDYIMKKKESWEKEDTKVYISWQEHVKRAVYYLKYMKPEVQDRIIQVLKELSIKRKRIMGLNTKREWKLTGVSSGGGYWCNVENWRKIEEELDPITTETNKIIDNIIKQEEAKRKRLEREAKEAGI